MKTLRIPFIEGLDSMSWEAREKAMALHAAKASADTVNWPAEWPYCPIMDFHAARGETMLFIMCHVRGLDLRAEALEDNGPVWEDSCCEFFVSDPSDGTYYNFEMNCIGTLLASKRKSRSEFVRFTDEQLAMILRYSSLARGRYDISDSLFSWETGIGIPFRLIGFDPDNLPASARANFYKCADRSAHPHFVSWNPIDVPSPDFHRPEFFGELTF